VVVRALAWLRRWLGGLRTDPASGRATGLALDVSLCTDVRWMHRKMGGAGEERGWR